MRVWRTPLDHDRIVAPRGQIQITKTWCKGCKFCVEYCPRDTLVLSTSYNQKGYHFPEVKDPDSCVDCKLCERLCPEFAIVVVSMPQRGAAPAAPGGEVPQPTKVAVH